MSHPQNLVPPATLRPEVRLVAPLGLGEQLTNNLVYLVLVTNRAAGFRVM